MEDIVESYKNEIRQKDSKYSELNLTHSKIKDDYHNHSSYHSFELEKLQSQIDHMISAIEYKDGTIKNFDSRFSQLKKE